MFMGVEIVFMFMGVKFVFMGTRVANHLPQWSGSVCHMVTRRLGDRGPDVIESSDADGCNKLDQRAVLTMAIHA